MSPLNHNSLVRLTRTALSHIPRTSPLTVFSIFGLPLVFPCYVSVCLWMLMIADHQSQWSIENHCHLASKWQQDFPGGQVCVLLSLFLGKDYCPSHGCCVLVFIGFWAYFHIFSGKKYLLWNILAVFFLKGWGVRISTSTTQTNEKNIHDQSSQGPLRVLHLCSYN